MRNRRRRSARLLACLICLGAVGLFGPEAASAGFVTGLADPGFDATDADIRANLLDDTVDADAGIVRLLVTWRAIAGDRPANPTDPADPEYNFSRLDPAVQDAEARGLDVLLTITSAPRWAEGSDRPADAPAGVWKPDPTAYGAFAQAAARRYSGDFNGLPRVRYYEAWNEPNLPSHLQPQWNGKRPVAPGHYRQMLSFFYSGIKSVHRSNRVVAGALAPYGDPPNQGLGRMRPLVFLRSVLCLRDNLKPVKNSQCRPKPALDIVSDHPINLSGGPRTGAIDHDDVSTPDLGRLRKVVRAAERAHTIAGGKQKHPLWVTEVWWHSNPPDPNGFPLAKHARYLEESFYLFWKAGAKVVIYLPLVDGEVFTLQMGLYLRDGTPKPALDAFRFPFVTERRSKRKVFAWGKAPETGRVRIQERAGGGWRTVKSLRVGTGQVFTAKLAIRGKARLRATVGGERSLVWKQGR